MQEMTLSDFEPEKIKMREQEKDETQRIMNLLGMFSASMLKDFLIENGGHPPPEWGDGETWRYYYLDECRRRGRKLLADLGWPDGDDALYVNTHTGNIEMLIDVATDNGYFVDRYEDPIAEDVWSIIEHWEPYDDSKPNHCRIRYLEGEIDRLKVKLENGSKYYVQLTRKELKEKESELKSEKDKPGVICDSSKKI